MNKDFVLQLGSPYITLQQLLKAEGIAYSGGSVKAYLEEMVVRVNGELEDRRGRKLYAGDVVVLYEPEITITIVDAE